MSEQTVSIPRHLQIFLAALKPVRQHLYSGLRQTVLPVVETPDFLGRIAGLLNPLELFVQNTDRIINKKLGVVVQRSDASEVEILSAVRNFEHELHSLLSAYQAVRALKVCVEDVYARQFLEEIYLHLFNQLGAWLDELLAVLSDPAGTLKKRGLPTSGYVNVPITLTLTSAPQLAKLVAWCRARDDEAGDAVQSAAPARIGWLATIGLTWLGWEFIEHLIGSDD